MVGVGDGADGGTNDPLPRRTRPRLRTGRFSDQQGRYCASDNPFTTGRTPSASGWIYGVRKPLQIHGRRGNWRVWFGDVGWNTWEEVNHGVRGANFGWPCYEGNLPTFIVSISAGVPGAPAGLREVPLRDVRPQRRQRRDRRADIHREPVRSSTREASSTVTTRAVSFGGSSSTRSATRSAP